MLVFVVVVNSVVCTDFYEVLGRIIAHAFITTDVWPTEFCLASLVATLTGSVSQELAVKSFVDSMSSSDQDIFKQLWDQETFENVSQNARYRFATSYGGKQEITKDNAKETLVQLALLNVVYSPYAALMKMARGLNVYTNLWRGVTEETLVALWEDLLPRPDKIIEALEVDYTTGQEVDARILEGKVVQYLEAFIVTLSKYDIKKLLIFWTAKNVLSPDDKLTLAFNSTYGIQRMPFAMTCSSTLTLSRYYTGPEDLAHDLNSVLSVKDMTFDSM